MIQLALGRRLEALGLVNLDEAGIGGDCFIEWQPDQPDRAVSIRLTGGADSDSKLPYDEQAVQILVRGTADDTPQTVHERALAIYSALHGATNQAWDPAVLNVWVVSCLGLQGGPVPIGEDAKGRHEVSLNFMIEHKQPTANRAA